MTTRDDIHRDARILGWEISLQRDVDVLWRADITIHVRYDRDGSVNHATRFRFFSIDNISTLGVTPGKHKKETILSWLAGG